MDKSKGKKKGKGTMPWMDEDESLERGKRGKGGKKPPKKSVGKGKGRPW